MLELTFCFSLSSDFHSKMVGQSAGIFMTAVSGSSYTSSSLFPADFLASETETNPGS